MKKNLVMGAAKGYGWDILEPFVISFIKNCSSAELILFVDDISDFTRGRLIQAGVSLKPYPNDLKQGVPNNTRWKIFSDFLKVHGDTYEQIFITDTRDVIFQADVFEVFKDFQSYLGLTTETDDIAGSKTDDRINYNWLLGCFGEEEADKLLDKKIICCGTVIGTTNEMKIFCHELWKILEYKTTNIFDQAVTNYLVYNNLLPIENLIEIDVDGEIFTMGLVNNFSVRGNKILNGRVPAIVHQYNRHESLIELVDEIYHDKNFQVDGRFTDIRSVTEQATCLLFANRVGDAARLFVKKFLVTNDFDGCDKILTRLWEITMRNPLSPASELLELSVQNALKSVENFSASTWNEICTLLNRAQECRHPVDPELKYYVVNRLLKLAEQKFATNEREQYLSYIELIISIEGGQLSWQRK